MNSMKKAAAISILSTALLLPSIAQADDMKPMAGGMNSGMESGMGHDMMMGAGDKAEMMMDGLTYVPLRLFAETLGYKVDWNGDDRSITMTYMNMGMDMPDKTDRAMKDMYTVKVMLDSKDIMVGMDKKMLNNAPTLMDGKAYVTKDFISMYLLTPFMMKSM